MPDLLLNSSAAFPLLLQIARARRGRQTLLRTAMKNLEITSTYLALRRNLARKMRQVGILGTIKHIANKLLRNFQGSLNLATENTDAFDLTYKTDTAGIVSVGALDIPDEKLKHSNRYEAVVPSEFFEILDGVPIEPEEYVFIDIGSGKG